METKDFLKWLLPQEGRIVLGVDPANGPWRNEVFETIEAAADHMVALDKKGTAEVYVAVNTFKSGLRTQDNVQACRAIFDDYDVKAGEDGHYQSKRDALNDIIKLATALRLTPTIVDSGGGYHVYYHLNEDTDKSTWDELSKLKRSVTKHLDQKVDRQCDLDSSRVLRATGTHNYKKKYGTPQPVTLLKQGKAYPIDTIRSALESYISNHCAAPITGGPVGFFGGIPLENKPTLDRNAALQAAMKGEDWHNNVLRLVASYVTRGSSDDEIHRLVADLTFGTKESQEQIQEMIDGARAKDWTPKDIVPVASAVVANVNVVKPSAATSATIVVAGETIPHWPNGFRWNSTALSREIPDPDGGASGWRPFCRTCIYPLNRVQDSEGTWSIHWRALEKNKDWRDFFMPMSELASTDQMAKTLATHEVFLHPSRHARSDMAEFAISIIEELQKWRIETKTYSQFGWLPDYSGFVMGTKMITATGETAVLCEDSVPDDIRVDFGRSGTLAEWVANVDSMYNRKGAEPLQFALCHSMGSILVELMGSSNWHGLPLAFTGHGGTGKSTACKVALGFYGKPKFMERQTGEQGSTLNATIKRVAIMGSVPILLDEFSGRTPEELTRTGYALANGRDKERLGTSGKFSTVGGEWYKNSFITSNDSILESISSLPVGYRVEATQLRFFEVQLPEEFTKTVFPDVTQQFIEHHMDHVYGEACLPFIRHIINNTAEVRQQITDARAVFNPSSNEDNKERFYRDTIVTALVAGQIAEKLDLVFFDLNSMKKWAEDHVKTMRENRKETNTSIAEHLAQFIATLQGRLIVTKRLGHGRSRKEDPSVLLRAPAVGRICTEEELAFVTAKSVSDWCKENGVAPKTMKEELDQAGYFTRVRTVYIGQGSTVASGLSRCYELNYQKLMTGSTLSLTDEPSDE